jgi:hypothetical protein
VAAKSDSERYGASKDRSPPSAPGSSPSQTDSPAPGFPPAADGQECREGYDRIAKGRGPPLSLPSRSTSRAAAYSAFDAYGQASRKTAMAKAHDDEIGAACSQWTCPPRDRRSETFTHSDASFPISSPPISGAVGLKGSHVARERGFVEKARHVLQRQGILGRGRPRCGALRRQCSIGLRRPKPLSLP